MGKINIYLRALEIGYDVGSDGISYNNLISKLTSEGYNTNKRITPDWYYLNFENPSRTRLKANPKYGYRDASDENFPLSYDSLMDYVDYLELKEARESSQKAIRFAQYAFIVSIVALIVNIFFSAMSMSRSQKVSVSTISPQVQEQVSKEILSQRNDLPKQEGRQKQLPQKKEIDSNRKTLPKKDTIAKMNDNKNQ